ncbi:MAG: HNH endonuclease [Nocardioides sp.]|nr:HNH endonuclease [Nocardioides sp.]
MSPPPSLWPDGSRPIAGSDTSVWRATVLARETACLALEDRLVVDELLAADHDAIEAMSERQVIAAAQAEGARLDAEAIVTRRRKAESERHVSIRPAPDTMVWLTALLPVKDGVAAYAALTGDADSARAQGDPRTKGQVMADELVRRVTGAEGTVSQESQAQPVALNLVMSHTSLLGTSDEQAHLADFGPIPAELARELVAGSLDDGEEVWLRRLYASPESGELVAMDSRARLFPSGLRRLITLRDRFCRTPWCDAPILHIDHVVPHEADGPTSGANGQGLCQACNHAKQAPRWRSRPGPDGAVTTATPTGHTHRSRPPVIATVTHRDVPRLTVDYVLAS